jgi:two-component system, response regulator
MIDTDEVEILLVDDDSNDVRLTLRALEKENLKNWIEVVRDGEEALDFVFRRGTFRNRVSAPPPKLILLDMKLPKVDGLEVLRQVKGNPTTQAIPVVILTSSKEERDLVEAYKLGANSYIQKPVDFDQFRQTIKATGFYWLVMNQPASAKAFEVERSRGMPALT